MVQLAPVMAKARYFDAQTEASVLPVALVEGKA
jgi:hypothetical protein